MCCRRRVQRRRLRSNRRLRDSVGDRESVTVRGAWLLIVAALLLSGRHDLPAQQPTASAAEARRFPFSRAAQQDSNGFYFQRAGLCEDYPEETTTSEKIAADFDVLRRTGTKLLRFGVGWDGIEQSPGKYDWKLLDEIVATAEREGVTVLPYVCYTPEWAGRGGRDSWREPPRNLERFGSFMHALASRYRGKVKSWELWNEPDNRDYWRGTPKQFAAMFKSGSQAVRRADPEAVIVLGGLTQPTRSAFFQAVLNRHGLGQSFDVLNFHTYLETWDNDRAEELPRRVEDYARGLQRGNPDARRRDIWLAEFGYSSLPPRGRRVSEWVRAGHAHEHTADFQAVALLRQHFLAVAAGQLSLSAWFRIRDLAAGEGVIGDDNNRHFGLVDVAGAPKPAFEAMRLWNQLMLQPVRTVRSPGNEQPASDAEVHVFERLDGAVIVAAWLRSPRVRRDESGPLVVDTRREIIEVQVPALRAAEIRIHRSRATSIDQTPHIRDGVLSGVVVTGDDIFIAELRPEPRE